MTNAVREGMTAIITRANGLCAGALRIGKATALVLALSVGVVGNVSDKANAGGWRHDRGAAAAAGIIGFAAGALAGSALATPRYYAPGYYPRRYYAPRSYYSPHFPGPVVYARPRTYYSAPAPVFRHAPPIAYRPVAGTPEWIAYCARKYKSFNPRTGTYLAYSGKIRRCR